MAVFERLNYNLSQRTNLYIAQYRVLNQQVTRKDDMYQPKNVV
jgi:hypothetical protein